ncbi:MAG: hypothetical protein QM723_07600 [Myxococcaceae bacterium]
MSFARALCVVAALSLAGCNCKETCVFTPVTGPGDLNHNPGVAGRPYTVKMPVPGNTSSCGENKFATSVTARVVDPNNMPVESTADSTLDGERTPVNITFTPVLPGPYHLTARFEPGFGLVQTDVWVANDRSDAGTHSLPVPFECARWDQLDERVFCIAPDAGTLGVVIDGGVVTTLPAYDFALAPERSGVWVMAAGNGVDTDALQFHLLDGGGLSLLDQALIVNNSGLGGCVRETCPPGTPYLSDARVIDRGGRALALFPPTYTYATVDFVTSKVVPQFFGTNDGSNGFSSLPTTPYAQWGPDDAVAVAGPSPFGGELCVLPLDGGPCITTPNQQGGATADAVWLFNATTFTLDGIGISASGAPSAFHVPINPPDAESQWPAPDTAPHWSLQNGGMVVLGSNGGDPAFEFFVLDTSDATWWGVDGRRFWKWSASTRQLTWIDR